jgi:hypothetical protein
MNVRPVGAELFHADGRTETDRHDKANTLFAILRKRLKMAPFGITLLSQSSTPSRTAMR